jgi:hypothetical protein
MSRGWGGVDFVRNRCLSHKQRGVSTIFTPIRLWHHQYFRSTVDCALNALQNSSFYPEDDPEVGKRASEPFEDNVLIRRLEAQFPQRQRQCCMDAFEIRANAL